MNIPHALVVDDCGGNLFVADRERSLIHLFPLLPPLQPPAGSPPSATGGQSSEGAGRRLATASASMPPGGGRVANEVETWDVTKYGFPYGMTAGPYGSIFVLCWARDSDSVTLVVMDPAAGGQVVQSWPLSGVHAPHDLTLTAAPLEVTGAGERAVAVYIAETRAKASSLRKFTILPPGVTLPEPSSSEPLGGNSSKIAGVPTVATPALESTALEHTDGGTGSGTGTDTVRGAGKAAATNAGRDAGSHPTPTAAVADMLSKAKSAKLHEQQGQPPPPRPERVSDRKGAALLGLPLGAVGLIALLWWKLRGPRPHVPPRFQLLPTRDSDR